MARSEYLGNVSGQFERLALAKLLADWRPDSGLMGLVCSKKAASSGVGPFRVDSHFCLILQWPH